MWRRIRILILLLILLFVALNAYFDRVYSTDWDIPLRVAVYPINADGSEASERFIRERNIDYSGLERFFAEEAREYGVLLEEPVRFSAAPQLSEPPPTIGRDPGPLAIAGWSLRTRYWAWRAPTSTPAPDVKMFVLYYDPARHPSLPHSTGQQKGLYAIVHAFADPTMRGSNEVVMAHELLHTLGASDKYALPANQPLYPIGFAEPDREPRYPQSYAELMAGRIPLSPTQAATPESLRQVLIGPATALEIGWTKP